jgi:hypothetical protein
MIYILMHILLLCASFIGKKLVQSGCKPEYLQHLTKRKIDPTRSSNNITKTLPGRRAGEIYPLFCEGCKHSGLQPGCTNFSPFVSI